MLAVWQSNAKAHWRALLAKETRARQYLDTAGVMMIALDVGGDVVLVNRKGCEILGYEEGEILGKNWFAHFVPDRIRDQVRQAFKSVFAGQPGAGEYVENVVLCRSAAERLIAWHSVLLHDPSGATVHVLCSGEGNRSRSGKQ